MIFILAADHGGYLLKNQVQEALIEQYGVPAVQNLGVDASDSVHYPLIADQLCQAVLQQTGPVLGILCCGSGIGVSIRANRYPAIRAALVTDPWMAEMAKRHNNANVLCFGGRNTPFDLAWSCVEAWLKAPFEGGRHADRVQLLDASV